MDETKRHTEITIDFSGVIELSVFLTIILALGKLLKLWKMSWWWVASPVLALVGLLAATALITFLVIVVKNLAERRL